MLMQKKTAAELKADTLLQTQTLVSEAGFTAAKNNADKFQILSKAEGKIAPWLEKKKEFETKELEMSVYNSLAENKDLIITGSDDADLSLIAVSDAILQSANGASDGNSRSLLLAQLALMNRGTAHIIGEEEKN